MNPDLIAAHHFCYPVVREVRRAAMTAEVLGRTDAGRTDPATRVLLAPAGPTRTALLRSAAINPA